MSPGPVRRLVPESAGGVRLDRFLADALPQFTRSALRRFIVDGRVRVDGRSAAKAGLALRAGSEIEILPPDPPPSRLVPESIPIGIVHEDADLVVVDKPAGLVVHPGHGRRSGTLVNALLGLGIPLAPAGGPDRPGIVHRLDRETSGLLVVAKTDAAHRGLARAFAAREVEKTYLALVWGRPSPAEGRVERPIGRSRGDRTKMSVRAPRGRPAVTVYRTLERLPRATLLEIDLVTGRTHQIRVHLASLGHGLVGDRRYGQDVARLKANPALRAAVRGFDRIALHAKALALRHPTRGTPLRFGSPVPADLEEILSLFRERA